jgi:hypothetical protein
MAARQPPILVESGQQPQHAGPQRQVEHQHRLAEND